MPDSIGERLSRIRHERGLSLQQLADRSGVAKSVLSYVETGKRPGSGLTLATALRLAWTLGVSLDVLAGTYERETMQELGEPAAVRQPGKVPAPRPRRRTAASMS
jgi:transcriptional regulator with XRE-family HTH domain